MVVKYWVFYRGLSNVKLCAFTEAEMMEAKKIYESYEVVGER